MLKKSSSRVATRIVLIAATVLVIGSLFLTSRRGSGAAEPDVTAKTPPKIEVVFALDTTSSMSGMIEGAKGKVWSIANQLASGTPRPEISFGLVGYRDHGDQYVTKVYPLSADMDEVYSNLMNFRAQGGGDVPEHVNQALSDSIEKIQWSQGKNVLRLVFLVGDAPPHNDYGDGLNSAALAKKASEHVITINTVLCGSNSAAGAAWAQIANAAGGHYTTIAQDGGMQQVETPFDGELAKLNTDLAGTMFGYGSTRMKQKVRKARASRSGMAPSAAADTASFSGKAGLGSGDLVEGFISGAVNLDTLSDDELPGELANMEDEDRKRWRDDKVNERRNLNKKIQRLADKRDKWLKDNAPKTGFDKEVEETIRSQAKSIGVEY